MARSETGRADGTEPCVRASARTETLGARFYGELTERSLVDSGILAGTGRVVRDQISGPMKRRVRTPDVTVDIGADPVVMEVVSGRVTYVPPVQNDADALARDLVKLVDEKLSQLSERSAQLLAGTISIGGVDMSAVERLWPMIVAAEGLPVAEPVWDHIRTHHSDAFSAARIKPVSIIDGHELELLMALVEEGHALPDLLAQKIGSAWAVLPFGAGSATRSPTTISAVGGRSSWTARGRKPGADLWRWFSRRTRQAARPA